MRYMITDGLWEAMEPLVGQAKRHKGGQPPVLPTGCSSRRSSI
jgi:hypothetical protein